MNSVPLTERIVKGHVEAQLRTKAQCTIVVAVLPRPPYAVGLQSNLEVAQGERSVLLLDEQNLLEKEKKEGCA